jgi:hypothetical protein
MPVTGGFRHKDHSSYSHHLFATILLPYTTVTLPFLPLGLSRGIGGKRFFIAAVVTDWIVGSRH